MEYVKNVIIISNNKTMKLNQMDTSKLSPSEKESLFKKLNKERKEEKEQVKANRKAYKELSYKYVEKNIDKLIHHNDLTEKIIIELFKDYKVIKDLKAGVYGDKIQDSHTSTLPDGSASITIGHNVSIGFDGTESSGVEKIKNFITSLVAEDENTKRLTQIVDTFLKPNGKTGMLNPNKIIQLNNLRDDFNDQQFNDGLDIILNAQQRRQNSMYVSGWKFIEKDGKPTKIDFRFTI